MKRTAMNKGHRWSDEELRLLMQLWDEGKTPTEIAIVLGSTDYSISKMVVRLRQQGIPLTRRRKGHQIGERAGKPWTQEEIEFVARRRIDGATNEEIGMSLGRTHHAVAEMVRRLREEGVPIAMRGSGVRRLWDPDRLRRTLLVSDAENVSVIRLDEERDRRT
jgi:biotin operon repressor